MKDFPGSINALWLRHLTEKSVTADFKKEHTIFRRDKMPYICPAIWSPYSSTNVFYKPERIISDTFAEQNAYHAPDPVSLVDYISGFEELPRARRERAIVLLAKLAGLYLPKHELDHWAIHTDDGEILRTLAKTWSGRV
ncbi:MAG: hypothetical protein ACYC6B_10150 [Thermoleophilia bacterium]